VERGKVVYHAAGAGNADCASCHVAYLPRAQWAGLMEKALGRKVDLSRVDPYTVQPRDSEPPVQVDTRGGPTQISKVLPPDFLVHPLRSVWSEGEKVVGALYTAERQRENLYRASRRRGRHGQAYVEGRHPRGEPLGARVLRAAPGAAEGRGRRAGPQGTPPRLHRPRSVRAD